jgi:ATP-dependent Clp protease ATP-binding subunit ClpA
MFEKYTEKARRVIFFARYEASQFGSPYIETEHLLLGILREDKALTNRFLRSHGSVESIRRQIEGHTTIREAVSTSVDLPISTPGKAFELLDAAGSMVKLRQAPPTEEIAEAEKFIKSIVSRVEKAIANHEFEKARYYSEEERKQRENLDALREKLPVDDSSSAVVGRDHLKEVISRWAAYPYSP